MVNYTIELSPNDLRIIGLALDDRPYKEVAGLCARIQKQITDQDIARQAEPEPS